MGSEFFFECISVYVVHRNINKLFDMSRKKITGEVMLLAATYIEEDLYRERRSDNRCVLLNISAFASIVSVKTCYIYACFDAFCSLYGHLDFVVKGDR
jgi:hypothetical protein